MQALEADPLVGDPGDPPVDLRCVSPELVLVDPELAAYARAHLPLGPVWSRPEPARDDRVVVPVALPEPEQEHGGRFRVWRSRALVVAVGLVLFGLGFAAMLGVLSAERTGSAPHVAAPAPVPSGATRLAWPPVPGADAYRIRVSAGPRVVLDQLVSRPSLSTTLRGGSYRWTVRAIGGPRDGALVVDASMTVAAS